MLFISVDNSYKPLQNAQDSKKQGYDQACFCLFIRKQTMDHNSHGCGQILTAFSQIV